MASKIEQRLAELGVTIPDAAPPAASYLTFQRSGKLLFTAGQLPFADGKLLATGLVGRDLDVAAAQKAARQCSINVLSQVKAACGDLEQIARIVKLTVFVASAPGFTDQHLVANGGSDFLVEVLGDTGRHARSAVGMASLPLNAPVEIEAIVELA